MSLLLRTAQVAALVTVLSAVHTTPATTQVASPAPVATAQVAARAPVAVRTPGAAAPAPEAPEGRYDWPLPGAPPVVRDFDPPPQRYGRGHRGVDLAGVPGQPVLAAASGTVLFAGPVGGRPVVSIQHRAGLRTTYEPVLPTVSPGEVVATGQRIGTLTTGHPGCRAAACLHWGLRRGGEYLDPLHLLVPGPLRLLPWEGRDTAPR